MRLVRLLLASALLTGPRLVTAQSLPAPAPPPATTELTQAQTALAQAQTALAQAQTAITQVQAALAGSWSGVLDYRDYQSNARVKLPTWAVVERTPAGLVWRYTYDDGPGKVVLETDTVTFTSDPPVWSSVEQGKPGTTRLSIQGLATLRNGRGTLVLTGAGTENGHAVDTRTTLHVTRNLLEITRETRIAGASFEFRDGYTLTRREPPTP